MTESFKADLWRPWESPCTLKEYAPVRCTECCSSFKRVEELKRHQNSCHSVQTRNCNICHEKFTRKDNLTRHMKNKHTEVLAVKPKCGFCFKRLSRQDAAARHQKTCHKNPARKSVSPVPITILRPNVIVSLESLSMRQTG